MDIEYKPSGVNQNDNDDEKFKKKVDEVDKNSDPKVPPEFDCTNKDHIWFKSYID